MSGPVIVNNPEPERSSMGPIIAIIAIVILLVVIWLLFFSGGTPAPGPGPGAS